jgi:hypothetical protein
LYYSNWDAPIAWLCLFSFSVIVGRVVYRSNNERQNALTRGGIMQLICDSATITYAINLIHKSMTSKELLNSLQNARYVLILGAVWIILSFLEQMRKIFGKKGHD